MHHTYHTEGFVIKSSNVGEANKYFYIFTKDFGMVGAAAQGVRLIKSKLRYSLQDYSYSKISLVRGKHSWRIVGAVKEKNARESLKENPDKFQTFARALSLLERLVRGEEKNEELFNHLIAACEFLEKEDLSSEFLKNYEYILVMRILRSLGYLAESKDFNEFVTSPYWTKELVSKISAVSRDVLFQINRSLKETQL